MMGPGEALRTFNEGSLQPTLRTSESDATLIANLGAQTSYARYQQDK